MTNPFRFRSSLFRAIKITALAVIAVILGAGTAFGASPAQAQGNSVFDNLIFIVIGGVLLALAASVVGGAVITALAVLGSRFFRRNLPTDEEMNQFRAELNRPGKPRRKPTIGPTAEPFVITGVGLVVVLFVVSLVLSVQPEPVQGEEIAPGAAEAPAASLPKEGDFVKITDGLPPGNAENGAKLFVSSGCVGCHSQKKDERLVGPTFYNLWNTAETRVPGLGPKEYLYQSIVDPNAHVVPTFQPNVMQQNFAALLSPQQMADILAWIEERHKDDP
jgi:mono/diheme cytochrome c family protein